MKKFFLLLLLLLPIFSYSQCIVINEIMINGGSCDGSCNPNTSEWVELYNTCNTPIDVSCYIISDGDWTYVIPSGTIIANGGYLTIGGASNEGSSPDLDWATANYTGTGGIGTFTNGGEQLALFDNSGSMIGGIIWGGGQDLSANNVAVTASGSCTVTNVDLPNSGSSDWEDIVEDGVDESTMARECDGESTWVNYTGGDITFGTENNSCIPMFLEPDSAIFIFNENTDEEEKVIMKIYDVLGQELYDFINGREVNMMDYKGIIIIRYIDGTIKKVNISN